MFLIAVEDFNILFRVGGISHRVWVERVVRGGKQKCPPFRMLLQPLLLLDRISLRWNR
jgi:hypothetical protein